MSLSNMLTQVDQSFDSIINSGSEKVFAALAIPSAEFLVLLAGAALAVWAGTAAFRGSFSLDGFITFVFRFALFYGAVSGGVLWTKYIYPFLTGFAVGVGDVIIREFGGTGTATGTLTAFGGFAEAGFNNIIGAWGSFGGLSIVTSGEGISSLLVGAGAFFGILIMTVLGLAFTVIAKVLMAIFLAITPVMMVWAYLRSTGEVFNGWVRGITMLILFQILLYGVLGILLAATKSTSDAIAAGIASNSSVPLELFKLAVISGISSKLIFICPMIAQRIGGAAINLGESQLRDAMPGPGSLLSKMFSTGGSDSSNLKTASNQRQGALGDADGGSTSDANNSRVSKAVSRGAERLSGGNRQS